MTKPLTLAEALVEGLLAQGVERIFGLPGGGSSLEVMAAARDRGIDFVLTRTETAAVLMAAVTGELTGRPGVALTGIGPGAASAVNGVAYAHLERAPLLLLTDGPASSQHQNLDQTALYEPITKVSGRLTPEAGVADLKNALDLTLKSPRGPVHFDLSADDARASVETPSAPKRSSDSNDWSAGDLTALKDKITGAKRPVILAGLEARRAPASLRTLAEALNCPVLLTYKAKGSLPDRHRSTVGLFTGAQAEAEVLKTADLILLFGLDPVEMIPGPWPYHAALAAVRPPGATPFPVSPDVDAAGDLATLAERLGKFETVSAWTEDEIQHHREIIAKRLALSGQGHTAESVMAQLSAQAPETFRLSVDSGAHMFSAMTCWQAETPFEVLKSNGLSTMGYALPAAIAASLETPARPVIAVTGDGGMMMSLPELATAVEQSCDILVVVLNDAALSLIDIKQQDRGHAPQGVRYPTNDFTTAAKAFGWQAWSLGPGDSLGPALDWGLHAQGPRLLDIAVDPSGYGDQLKALRG